MTQMLPEVKLPAQFRVRLDPYWQSVAIYAVTLIVYVMVKAMWESTLQTGIVNVVLTDPIVVLLGLFVLISLIALLMNMISHRAIIVAEDGIAFLSRFHERTFALDEIERIAIGRDRRVRVRGMLSLVKVTIRGRKRPLHIRPAVYENEHMLVSALLSLRKQKDLNRA